MTRTKPQPAIVPLTVDAVGGAKLLGFGRSLFLEMDADGRLGPQSIRFGRKRVWDREELIAWFKAGRPRRERWAVTKTSAMKVKAG